MKKSKISGWKDVYLFTFVQTVKSKAYIGSLVVMLVIAALAMPIMSAVMSGDENENQGIGEITKIYVLDQTMLDGIGYSDISLLDECKGVEVIHTTEEYDALSERVNAEEKNAVIVHILYEAGMYSFQFAKPENSLIKESNLSYLSDIMIQNFEEQRMNLVGIEEWQKEELSIPFHYRAYTAQLSQGGVQEVVPEDTSITTTEYGFLYAILFVVFIVSVFSSTQISTSIVSDKSSKVIEYLLTSIKPLALIVGKVLAMLLAVLLQLGSIILMVLLSSKVTGTLFGTGENILKEYIPEGIFSNLSVLNILLCIIIVALGLVFYATIAGLTGACVSRIEEAGEGTTLYIFVTMIGFYIAIIASSTLLGMGENSFVRFALLFPLSSSFLLPGAVLIGKASVWIVLISILLLVVCIGLIFRFTAKVFENLILHNGNKVGLKELFQMSKMG